MKPMRNALAFACGAGGAAAGAIMFAQLLQSVEGGINATNMTGDGQSVPDVEDDEKTGGLFSTQFIVCFILAVIVTLIAVIACRVIGSKTEYASGEDLPASLVPLSNNNKGRDGDRF